MTPTTRGPVQYPASSGIPKIPGPLVQVVPSTTRIAGQSSSTRREQSTKEIHRLTDPAWINWAFNEFGWVPGSETAWLLSEQSGYSHLYTIDAGGRQNSTPAATSRSTISNFPPTANRR